MPDSALAPACWTADNAHAITAIEALSGGDDLFLATHTPLRGFKVGGTQAHEVRDPSDAALLDALATPRRTHAFCVVQGEPGSGKSHLIRWMKVNWPHDDDLCILIQRANGSLEGALRQLQARLPPDYAHLFDRLGRRHAATAQGRAMQFLSTLGVALTPNYFTRPLDDEAWCAENDVAGLIRNRRVQQEWGGPQRILSIMDGGADRNSASASFDLQDILSLSRYCDDVHDSVASERLARRIQSEADIIADQRTNGLSWDDIRTQCAPQLKQSFALIDALNLRRNYAVQNVIGVSADGLKMLFEELRAEIEKRAKAGQSQWRRVVLLLEDITSWEGLDDSLVDALVTDAGTRPDQDLCPLISVVGVTPDYFRKLPANYRQRITHDVRLGDDLGLLQDVAALRESHDRASFIARYLNAARAGADQLKTWHQNYRRDRALPVPNPCGTCPRSNACHAKFGEIDGFGLFPFTRSAVDNLFEALKVGEGGMTQRTPRGVLQSILTPTLSSPDNLEMGAYPGPEVEPAAIERPFLSDGLRARIQARVDDPLDQDRLRRLLSYWGDGRLATARTADGEMTFGGVAQSIFAAFGLPWIGDHTATPTLPSPAAPTTPDPARPAQPQRAEPAAPAGAAAPRPAPAPAVQPETQRPPRTPAAAARPTNRELDQMRRELDAFRTGGALANPARWNAMLSDVLSKIDHRRLGVDRWTWAKVFTAETVRIRGTGREDQRHFTVGREPWLVEGLGASLSLRRDQDMTAQETEFARRRYALLLRRLEVLAAAHLDARIPRTPDGERWNPVASVVQILLTRAWLRGATSPDDPLHDQWRVILSDEAMAEAAPTARTQPWQDALSATKNRHDQLRSILKEMIRLPQGDSPGFGLADTSVAALAMLRLLGTLKFDPVPQGSIQISDLEMIRETAAGLAEKLPKTPELERQLLVQRGETLKSHLLQASVDAHLQRIDGLIDSVSTQMPNAAASEVRDWKAALQRSRRLLEAQTARALGMAIMELNEDASVPMPASRRLALLAKAPAADLKDAIDLVQLGDKAIEALLPHVRDLVRETETGVDLASIQASGAKLTRAASEAQAWLAT